MGLEPKMSYLIAAPEALAAASADLSSLGERITEATAAAAPSTTGIVPAAMDEVSAAITRLFGGFGQQFQALSAQGALFHDNFAQALTSGGNLYSAAEALNAAAVGAATVPPSSITDVGGAPFSPFLNIFGRALFGNGLGGIDRVGGSGGEGGR